MFNHKLEQAMKALNIDKSKYSQFDVLVLPEVFDDARPDYLPHDTIDAGNLAKALKAEQVKCGTTYDLGIQGRMLDRHGGELWLGLTWILNEVVAPVSLNLMANYIYDHFKRINTKADLPDRVHSKLWIDRKKGQLINEYQGPADDYIKVLRELRKTFEEK